MKQRAFKRKSPLKVLVDRCDQLEGAIDFIESKAKVLRVEMTSVKAAAKGLTGGKEVAE